MTSMLYPILFVDLLRQASYKNAILLGIMHKQMVYFAKKYSKSNRITLGKTTNTWDKDNIKLIKNVLCYKPELFGIILFYKNFKNVKVMRYCCNNKYFGINIANYCIKTKNILKRCIELRHTLTFIFLLKKSINKSTIDTDIYAHCAMKDDKEFKKILSFYGDNNMFKRGCYVNNECLRKGYISDSEFITLKCGCVHRTMRYLGHFEDGTLEPSFVYNINDMAKT